MLLIGMFDSPFVRPVAISMKLLDIPFEHADWSVGKDFERIRRHNPLGRVPTLVLDDGEALMETSAILDYLDERAGPERALLPRTGRDRQGQGTALRAGFSSGGEAPRAMGGALSQPDARGMGGTGTARCPGTRRSMASG